MGPRCQAEYSLPWALTQHLSCRNCSGTSLTAERNPPSRVSARAVRAGGARGNAGIGEEVGGWRGVGGGSEEGSGPSEAPRRLSVPSSSNFTGRGGGQVRVRCDGEGWVGISGWGLGTRGGYPWASGSGSVCGQHWGTTRVLGRPGQSPPPSPPSRGGPAASPGPGAGGGPHVPQPLLPVHC